MRLEVKKYAKTQAWDAIFDGLLAEYVQVTQEAGDKVLAQVYVVCEKDK